MAESVAFPQADVMHQIRMAGVKKGYRDEESQAVVKVFEEFADITAEHPDGFDEDYLSWEEKG